MSLSPYKMTPDQLYEKLQQSGFEFQIEHHAPLLTVDDAKAIRESNCSSEGQIKNLFLLNKKKQMWLLTLHEDRKIDLKNTAIQIGAGRFSFCNEHRLMDYLGVQPGAVSPLGLLNDTENEVQFYIDKTLLDHEQIHVHPFDSSITLTMKTKDLLLFLKQQGHPYQVLYQHPSDQ